MTDREIVKALRKQIHVRTVADSGGTNLLILAADAIERLEQDYDAVKQFFHTQCMKVLKENKQLESENAEYRRKREAIQTDVGDGDGAVFCPACHEEIAGYYASYCEQCGQALDRGLEDERKEEAAEAALQEEIDE